MHNVTIESLKKIHGDKAESVFREIADKGGFGAVGTGEGSINPNYEGGLDIAGVLADSNTALTSAQKDKIAELAGADRAKATALVDKSEGGESSASKMKSGKEK
jgi:hypothetical protein